MSDNHRRYYAIHQALKQLMPYAKGHLAQHLVTLAALICGIVGSKNMQLPAVATKIPGDAKRQSRITTLERYLKHKTVIVETFYVPLSPYRPADAEEAMRDITANGGLDKIFLSFYKQDDLGNDGVWDIWRLDRTPTRPDRLQR